MPTSFVVTVTYTSPYSPPNQDFSFSVKADADTFATAIAACNQFVSLTKNY